LGNTTFYFLDNEFYFKRGGAYGFYDDGERFAFFDRAVLDAITHMDFAPDIIHCNDWQTGMIPVLMHHYYKGTVSFAKVVYSIHNMKFQGIFPRQMLTELLGLDDSYFDEEKLRYYDCISFMKGGIVYSDYINTVSETYAEEIQNDFYGEGLNGILTKYKHKLCGVLNGIDYEIFNPETDSDIIANFSAKAPSKKIENKLALQKELGLTEDENTPLIGIVSRLTSQKGFDLVIAMIEEIVSAGAQLVILGTGEDKYKDVFCYYASRYPSKISANITFSDSLARKIYAGSDLFLMPSLFEPCGLGQLIALRYGSVPIVRETGGLKDTIKLYNEYTGEGNGFSFTNFNAHDMMHVINLAIEKFHNKDIWNSIVKNALDSQFSWDTSAKKYISLYKNLLK